MLRKVPCGTLCKTQHRINEDVVLSLVSEMLKAIAEYAKHDRAEFVRVVQEAQSSQQTAEVRKQRTRLATAKQRVSELEVLLCKIYEDNILGKLSDSRYATLDAQYENRIVGGSRLPATAFFHPSGDFADPSRKAGLLAGAL